MNKLKYKFILIALSLPLLPVTVEAANVGGIVPTEPPPTIDIPKIITAAINWAFGFLIVLAAAFILYAAYLYLMGSGSDDSIKKAKNVIVYAVVAIVIAFISRGLISIVQNLLTP